MRLGPTLGLICVLVMASGCTGRPSSGNQVGGSGAHPTRPTQVEVSLSHCGRGWAAGSAGEQSFLIHDSDSRAAEVRLVDPVSGGVYAAVEPLAPGRSATLQVVLGPGHYALSCGLEDEDVVIGPVVTVTGSLPPSGPPAATAVRPVTQQDLLAPTRAYSAYVSGRLPQLARDVARLKADLGCSRVAAAKRDWLTAHLDYERLGGAYGAFGDADGAINGLPVGGRGGLREGARAGSFTGFHRIEQDLWHGAPTARLEREAAALAGQVERLRRHFVSAQIDPGEVAIRAHEITENALELEATGRTDFGSHSELATVRANLDGTRTVLDLLAPLLRQRYAALPATLVALDRARADLDREHPAAGWLGLAQVSRAERERIDSDVSELTELLAPVATICEPRKTR